MATNEDPWAAATFEGNEREQLQRWAKMTLTQKVRWLEEAQRLALKLQRPAQMQQAEESGGNGKT
jgi:hypothetical protein